MSAIRERCDAAGNWRGCGLPVAYVARHSSQTTGEFVCAKHLAPAVNKHTDGSWTVAVVVKGAGARLLNEEEK